MAETPRYRRLRRELIDIVFSAAFPPTPTEHQPPPELFWQLAQRLEHCSLWGLLKRLHILEPEQTLAHRVTLWAIIHQAADQVRQEEISAIAKQLEESGELERLSTDAEQEFGQPQPYDDDSPVLYLKAASLISSLDLEVVLRSEQDDVSRQTPSGVNVVEFVDAFIRCHRGHSVFAMDWDRLKVVAEEFDHLIQDEIAS